MVSFHNVLDKRKEHNEEAVKLYQPPGVFRNNVTLVILHSFHKNLTTESVTHDIGCRFKR